MFYEVKVLDSSGNVKKVISPKTLSNQFWRDNFSDNQTTGTRAVAGSGSVLDLDAKDESAGEATE